MVFGWDRNVVGMADQQDIVVEDLEELLDIIEDYFETKVISFELCEFTGDPAIQGEYSRSIRVKFKNDKKHGEEGLIVGHVKSEKKNKDNASRKYSSVL